MSELNFIDVHSNLGNRLAAQFSAKSLVELADIEAAAGVNRMVVASWSAAANLDLVRWNTLLFDQARGRADTRVWLTLHPLFTESLLLLEKYAEAPETAGVRLHPQTGRYLAQYSDTFELAERVSSYRLPLLINVEMGAASARVEYALKLADTFPDMPVIAAHMGVAEGFH
jgi:predicted TIM-barrel fold metal-dependent hydrolase